MRTILVWIMLGLILIGTGCLKSNRDDLPKISTDIASALVKKNFQSVAKRFSPDLAKVLNPEIMENYWNSYVSTMGPFQRLGSVRSESEGKSEIYYVDCIYEKNQISLKIVYDSAFNVNGLSFTPKESQANYQLPSYADSTSLTPEEVTLGHKGWELPGSLFLPAKDGKFPAVVLIHGSGPQDRYATIGPNKFFLDLAYGLVHQGFAVLCYEKRTRQYASRYADGTVRDITVKDETIDDAVAAGQFLKSHPRIKADKIFLAGHSLGGMLIPRIDQQTSLFAGYVIMAAPARPLEDILLEQLNYAYAIDGELTAQDSAALADLKKKIEMVKSPALSSKTPITSLPYNTPAGYWLDLRGYAPAQQAKLIRKPVLIVQGQRDYQTTYPDYKEWQAALQKNKNVTFKAYPDLNHLFMVGQGMSYPNEYNVPNHVDLQMISDMAKWMDRN
ncbi:MAG: alpha/beta fold hydrolase [Candidatus Delongbacteria bacterium]|nr:alpha/beta fold hydrolase [Candidatus Delongbacteria bacterium]